MRIEYVASCYYTDQKPYRTENTRIFWDATEIKVGQNAFGVFPNVGTARSQFLRSRFFALNGELVKLNTRLYAGACLEILQQQRVFGELPRTAPAVGITRKMAQEMLDPCQRFF